jgi:AraC family transcriptional regulator, arabinose operon regulatory protein
MKELDMQELFSNNASSVQSDRILYTPSAFARGSLLHLQEVGTLKALHPHTSTRSGLVSYLCFLVLEGEGSLTYDGRQYSLKLGDCVFTDCRKTYSHSTSDCLWSLSWCHFYAPFMPAIYEKYKERGGLPVFHPEKPDAFQKIFVQLYELAASSDYIRDMRINESLSALLTLLMQESWNPDHVAVSKKRMELAAVKAYMDEHYTQKLTLDDLEAQFFINKYYLLKIFKETYGMTISSYLISKRITRAKQLLRFTQMTIDEVGCAVGMDGAGYFSRMFKKAEGISPKEYRKQWQQR